MGKLSGLSTVGSAYSAVEPGRLGFGRYGRGRDFPRLSPRATPSDPSIFSSTKLQAYVGSGVMNAARVASMDSVGRHNALNRIAAFAPVGNFGSATHSFANVGASGAIRHRTSPGGALLRNNGHTSRMTAPHRLEYHLDVLSLLATGPRQALRDLWRQPGSPNAGSAGYFTFSGIR